ncbi:MAG TPA: hypothetical protein DCW71_00955 [Alistipes sp.]|nr:hypothetical protein [Alistipes sp.]
MLSDVLPQQISVHAGSVVRRMSLRRPAAAAEPGSDCILFGNGFGTAVESVTARIGGVINN